MLQISVLQVFVQTFDQLFGSKFATASLGSAPDLNLELPVKTVIYLTNHAILSGSPINQKSSIGRRRRPKGSTGGFTKPINFEANGGGVL